MSRAASNVVVKFVLQGVDKVSAVMNGVASSTDKVTRSVQRAGAASQRAGRVFQSAFSGDVVGSVEAVSGALGNAGLAGAAAAATAGTVALGAAITAAAIKTLEWSTEVERVRAQLDQAFGNAEGAIAFANAVGGVSAESVAKLRNAFEAANVKGEITTELLQKMTARAARFGATGDEAIQAFTAALRSGETGQLRAIGLLVDGEQAVRQYAKGLRVSSDALDLNAKVQAIATEAISKAQAVTDKNSAALSRNESVLQRLNNTILRAKLFLSDLTSGPAGKFLNQVLDIVDATRRWGKVIAALIKVVMSPFLRLIQAQAAAVSGLLKVFDAFESRNVTAIKSAVKGLGTDVADALNIFKDIKDLGTEFDKALKPAVKSVESETGSMVNAFGRVNEAVGALGAVIRQKGATAQSKGAGGRKAKRNRMSVDEIYSSVAANAGELLFDAQAPSRAAAAQAQASRELLQARIEAATNPVRKVELELQAIEIDNAAKIAEITAKVTDARARDLALQAQAIAVETKRTQALSKFAKATDAQAQAEKSRQMATVEGWVAIGSATAQGIASMLESERKRAAIMAVVSAADAAVQFMRGNIPGAIAGGFAAVKYGAVALGAGAAGSAAGAGRFGAGGTAAERQAAPTATTDSGPRVVNITLGGGFVIGTPQMVGKSVAKAMKSLDGTGYEAAA